MLFRYVPNSKLVASIFLCVCLAFQGLLPGYSAFAQGQASPSFTQSTDNAAFMKLEDASHIPALVALFVAAYGSVEAMQGRKVVIVIGEGNADEDIVPQRFQQLANQLKEELEAQGLKVTILVTPSKEELERELQDADAFIFIGHGNSHGHLQIRRGRSGTAWDLTAGLLSRMLHGRRLRLLILITCSAMNPKTQKLWKQTAIMIAGYDDVGSHVFSMLAQWQDFVWGYQVPGLPRLWGVGPEVTLPLIRRVLHAEWDPTEFYEQLLLKRGGGNPLPPNPLVLHTTRGAH